MEVPMGLIIVGGILVGSVGLGALYDFVAKRRGKNGGRFGRAPGNPSHTAETEHNSFII
jgi:hypothetical protein